METPGTAPGSDPLITSAFMSIVPKDALKVGDRGRNCNLRVKFSFVLGYELVVHIRFIAVNQLFISR